MKKSVFGCLCLLVLASCNVKNSEEYKRLAAERDSLAQVSASNNAELQETMSIINDVESNFAQIREAENYLTIQSKEKGSLSSDKRTEIKDNLEMVNDIIKKNKEEISKLNQRLKNSNGETSKLKSTIERLNKELNERAKAVTALQEELKKRDAQIAELETSLQVLSENVDGLMVKSVQQASKIKEQDIAINTGYYMFGTKSELKKADVISGNNIKGDALSKEKFINIDIRDAKEIPLYAKKAKIISEHPSGSYSFEKDVTGNQVLKISDYQKFWSLTKFLVIQVD